MKAREGGGGEQRVLLRHISSSLYFGNDNTERECVYEREKGGRKERDIDFQLCSACVDISRGCFSRRVRPLVRGKHRFGGRISREKPPKNWNVC